MREAETPAHAGGPLHVPGFVALSFDVVPDLLGRPPSRDTEASRGLGRDPIPLNER